MKTLDVMTKQDLMKPSRDGGYNLTAYYIRMHWKDMGGYGKPLIFDRELVELHLREKMWGARISEEARKSKAKDLQAFIENKVRSIQSAVSASSVTGKIQGKGGRHKVA